MRAAFVRKRGDVRALWLLVQLLAALAAIALAYIGWMVVGYFAHVLWLLLFACLLAFVLSPAASALQHQGLARAPAVFAVYLLLMGGLVLLVILAMRPLSAQWAAMSSQMPSAMSGSAAVHLDQLFRQHHMPVRIATLQREAYAGLQHAGQSVLADALPLVTALASFVIDLILIVVISMYLLIDARRIHDSVARLIPAQHRDRAFFAEATVRRVLGGYIRGQLLMAAVIGVLYGAGCFVLGVQYPLLIGVLAGLFELIPMIGPVLGAIPAVAIALTQNTSLALWVVVYYLVIQQLESHVIGPRITGRAVGLHPLGAIIALIVGVEIDGLVGALLGVPIAGMLYVFAMAVYWELSGGPPPVAAVQRGTGEHQSLHQLVPWSRQRRAKIQLSEEAVSSVPEPPQALTDLEDRALTLRERFEQDEAARATTLQAGEPSDVPDLTAAGEVHREQ